MSWIRFFHRRQWDEERAREMDAYLELETAENVARGMGLEEARFAARRKLGNPTRIREEIYRMNSIGLIEAVWQDLRYGWRMLWKDPGFTAVAVLSLALGIGANTAVFSVVNAVLLRGLPYPEAGRLMHVEQLEGGDAVSIPELEFWKEHSESFASAAGYRGAGDQSMVTGAGQEWIRVMPVTEDFLHTLGVQPAMGREFNRVETRPGGPLAVMLSDGLWRRSFGADPHVVGRAVRLGERSFTVIGVLPHNYWFPNASDALVAVRPIGGLADAGTNTYMLARLRPGTGTGQADAEMRRLTASFRRVHPGYGGLGLVPFQKSMVGDVRTNLLLLFGAVTLLLLIACSNLASLLLARLASRQREIALRLALGSSRGRLLAQFVTENLMLGLGGCLAGLLAAHWLLEGLVVMIPFHLPSAAPIRLDGTVLGFTLVIALATGLLFSLAPFATSTRIQVYETLKGAGRVSGTPGRQRTRSLFVVSEMALSVTLLVAAGLLIGSLYQMQQERLGFSTQGLVTFETPLEAARHKTGADLWRFETELLEHLQRLPGVRGVAAINILPLAGYSNLPTQREGHPEHSIGGMEVRLVTPAYFELMGIPVVSGHSFTNADSAAAPAVILVNETLARRWWPKGRAIGDRVVIGRFRGKDFPEIQDMPREVAGVVADTKTAFLKEPAWPTVFIPAAQASQGLASGEVSWVVRSDRSAGFEREVRRVIAAMDPRQRVLKMRSMGSIVEATTASSRFDAWLFATFAGLALVLTAVGIYGLLSFSVARRTSEIGTRMALGASRGDVMKLVLGQGLRLIAIGLAAGLAGALATSRLLASLLFGIRPTEPLIFAAVAGLLLAVGCLASYLPARRATRVDPMTALRQE